MKSFFGFVKEKFGNHAPGSGIDLSHGQLLNVNIQGAGNAASNYVTI